MDNHGSRIPPHRGHRVARMTVFTEAASVLLNRCGRGRGRRPVKERLVEAIGVWPWRSRVKRRKAAGAGESASSDKAQYLLVLLMYWRRHGHNV